MAKIPIEIKKRGVFYTVAAIALTVLIVIIYSTYTIYRLVDKLETIETRIDTVNFFIKDVEKDIKKGAFIAGFRTLLSFNQYINTNGSFIDDINARFEESFINGTINSTPLKLMVNSTIKDWASRISSEAEKVDIKFNLTVQRVQLSQNDPWSVVIGLNLSLYISDRLNTSYWIREVYPSTSISILGFEDPLYVVNSKGRVTNTISSTNITDFVVNKDVTNLMIHANNSFYIGHSDAPSFLMRLEGNLGSSQYGIESLVNLEEFIQQGLAIQDRSVVDYIYFGSDTTVNHRINNTPDWFKIDDGHLDFYQVRNICLPTAEDCA
jgi:hypothetical protein